MAFRNYFMSSSSRGNAESSAAESSLETIKFEGRNLKLTRLIAEGGFSYVYFGDFGGQTVAVKKILTPDRSASDSVGEEINFLSSLDHRNIVKLLGVKTSSVENYIVMEYCAPLPPSPQASEELTGNIFHQCCNAVEYLHNLGIAHRDVKVENFLVGADGYVKLVDFGSATREIIKPSIEWNAAQRGLLEERVAAKTTPMYRAPELLDLWMNYQIDTRVDLWALGCLLYLLNYGTHPFPDSSKLAIINAKYVMKTTDSFSHIIRGLLQPNPDDRLTFQDVFNYLSSFHVFTIEFRRPVTVAAQEPPKNEEKSLFSSLRGGAESLFKNIKENLREITTEGVSLGGVNNSVLPPPSRGPPPPTLENELKNNEDLRSRVETKLPPPRPPSLSKNIQSNESDDGSSNFYGERRNSEHNEPILKNDRVEEEKSPVGVLLDFADFQNSSSSSAPLQNSAPSQSSFENYQNPPNDYKNLQNPTENIDLLSDLFGTSSSIKTSQNNDIFGDFNPPVYENKIIYAEDKVKKDGTKPIKNNVGEQSSKSRNLLDDLDLFGSSTPNMTSTDSSNSTIPTSSSFSSLGQLKPERLTKNVSTPNLPDLLGTGQDSLFGNFSNIPPPSSNKSTAANNLTNFNNFTNSSSSGAPTNNLSNFGNSNNNNRPNYSRSAFDTVQDSCSGNKSKSNNLNDVFGEFLKSEGFSVSSSSKNQTIQELRRQEQATSGMDPIHIKITNWKEGKTKNIRALLSSLHTVTWEGCHWEEVSMAGMITPAQVKKCYRKACLAIHPDKQVGSEHETLAKCIFIELNEAWSAFEEIK